MRILLDTQCWLWMVSAPMRLSERARALVASTDSELYLSAASAWEIAIKHALGKLRLPEPPARYVPSRLEATRVSAMSIELGHALAVAMLPRHHRDPLDRLPIVQAQLEDLPILTADPVFASYDVATVAA